jgi:class 3 adenylate cyclase/tetratricopeptide (TPR) repeat protein
VTLCPSCGRENPPDARFCNSCAAPLAGAAEPAREERKVVTVFFADLVGFTQRAETMDPEDVRSLLAPYWEHVRSELERLGGTVEKFIGDAVMALFGAPVAHEDDPERAVRAALSIRNWAIDEQVQVRIAVTTGEALVRLGAHPESGEGMASGDVVNTAARLQSAAPVNGILVGETTYRATRDEIQYQQAEPVVAKGKSDPIEVWEVVDARSRFGVDVEQDARTPLVGRARELEELKTALVRAREDRTPQLTTLIGVPGIGKSRLVRELFAHVDSIPDLVRWRQGRSLPYGEGVSFWALGEMVKAHAGILETDDSAAAEAKLAAVVAAAPIDASEHQRLIATLRPLVGLAGEEPGGGDRRAELFASWRRFFEALAEQTPLVLVFEDLHWSDDDLLDFVDHLVEWATEVPLLVVCTARPELLERRPGWGGGKPNARTLSLSPLRDEETARLFGVLLERALLPAELQAELLARAGGNPLYAEQYARMLVEREGAELTLPETVHGIIAARLDALTSEEKGLLQDAAVLGKVFWAGALGAIGGIPAERIAELLHGLQRKEFVQRAHRPSVEGESEYAFKHLLVRDVAYGQIPRAARAGKHRLAAEWIESMGRPEDQADLLAHHYLSAIELGRAVGADSTALAARARVALREAGDRAAALNAFAPALRFYRAALDLWEPVDPGYVPLLSKLAHAHADSGQTGAEPLKRARDTLLAAGEVEAAAEITAKLAHATWFEGNRDGAMQHMEQASALVAERPQSRAKALVLAQRCRFHMLASENEEAQRVGLEALAMIDVLDFDDLRPFLLNSVGVARATAGDLRGLADLESSIELAEARGSIEAIRGYLNLGSVIWSLGDLARAQELHRRGLERAREFGHTQSMLWLTGELAIDEFHAGEWVQAQASADRLIEAVEAGSPHYMEPAARAVRAWLLAARGEFDAAVAESARGLELARAAADPQTLLPAVCFHAHLQLEAGLRVEAGASADEALALCSGAASGLLLSEWTTSLAWTLHALDRTSDTLITRIASEQNRTVWVEASEAIATGDLTTAADVLARMENLTWEARVRLSAAAELVTDGRRAEADEQLARALAFYRSVGAGGYVRLGEALLAATA